MKNFTIDINCDLGEGIGSDEKLITFLSSCNIACGGHAGDEYSMLKTILLAKKNKVKIGAHPSFPDKESFGRSEIYLPKEQLSNIIYNQIIFLNDLIKKEKSSLHHVKPHGALYTMASTDFNIAEAVIEAIKKLNEPCYLYVPFSSVISALAIKENIPIKYEGFIDRNYNDNLTLVSRKFETATLNKNDPLKIFEHLYRMVSEQKVKSINNKLITIQAKTFCIHGDNPNASNILKYLHKKFKEVNISVL